MFAAKCHVKSLGKFYNKWQKAALVKDAIVPSLAIRWQICVQLLTAIHTAHQSDLVLNISSLDQLVLVAKARRENTGVSGLGDHVRKT